MTVATMKIWRYYIIQPENINPFQKPTNKIKIQPIRLKNLQLGPKIK